MGSAAGVFAGYGRIVLHNGTRVYSVHLPSGIVTDLGPMSLPAHQDSESWAFWGVAEHWGGADYLVCVQDSRTITRTRVPDGLSSVVASFANLADMASFTVAVPLQRWYFHHEGSSQFGACLKH